ncbi:MAG TPA: class I SAM-dependent methyltransferase [Acidimicrobiales bacterium]|nr:class I SAM-dependent methyltransferase [Acidimicrobiales bacterium]
MVGHETPDGEHYDRVYGHFADPVYAEIRAEAYGEDIGQNNWSTADEHRRFLAWLELTPADRMLDVACGSGGPTIFLARESGCAAVGVDCSAEAVAYGNELARREQLSGKVEFDQVDADGQLPYDDASFEAVVCLDAINHLADRERALADWARVLKPGGRLLFTDCITLTGLISDDEVASRSRIGHYVFAPLGEDTRLIGAVGLDLRITENVTESLAVLSGRRLRARAARAEVLRQLEGQAAYEDHQDVLRVAEQLAVERRLSRFAYLAVSPGSPSSQ